MRGNLAIYALSLAWCFAGSSSRAQTLRWENPNRAGEVQAFNVFAKGPLPSAQERTNTVRTNQLDLAVLFRGAPPGRYSITVESVGTNGVPSSRSEGIGTALAADGTITIETAPPLLSSGGQCTNLVFSNEKKGVVWQALHDKAHTYSATSFQALSPGSICKIALHLRKVHQPTGTLTLSVWSDFKSRPAALLAVSSTQIDAAQIIDGWYDAPIRFDALAGQTYWVGFSGSNQDSVNNILWLGGGTGALCYSADGLSWVFSANQSMDVRMYH